MPFSYLILVLQLLLYQQLFLSIFLSYLSILHRLVYLALANLLTIVKGFRKSPAKKLHVDDNIKNHQST